MEDTEPTLGHHLARSLSKWNDMAHFAHITNGTVDQVIVIDQETLNTGLWGDPSEWVQTSYNTYGGKHPEGRPLRKNYAVIGYTYDVQRDAFIPPKPYASWLLNEESCLWEAPITVEELMAVVAPVNTQAPGI